MANLRVNKITGTEVFETTGSVQFSSAGTRECLIVSSSSDFAYGTGDFTIEGWVLFNSNRTAPGGTDGQRIFLQGQSGTSEVALHYYFTNQQFELDISGTGTQTISYGIGVGQWFHVALVRTNSTKYDLYVDGKLIGTKYSSRSQLANNFIIGGLNWADNYGTVGHISNVRIVRGAVYTKNFTPPTRELTVIPNTVLLCCQSTTRANEERTGKTITVNGNAVANELTPGLLTDRIRSGGSSAISGSVEFNGTGSNYLSLASSSDFNLGTGDFTVECFVYLGDITSNAGYVGIFNRHNFSNSTGWGIWKETGGKFGFWYNAVTQINGTSNVATNQWYHIAAVRNGSTISLYVNGVLENSASNSSFNDASGPFGIGAADVGATWNSSYPVKGFISNLRVIKGTALYTQNFIPPTRELKNLPGTVLLCCQNSKSATQEATGKTISLNGSVTSYSVGIGTTTPNPSNFTPRVGSDNSIVFDGVTKINSPNYFYLPTGTTEDRGRGRGVFGGGDPGATNNISFIEIQSTGNAQDFGDLTVARLGPGGFSSSTRGVFSNGFPNTNTIDYITISTTSNAVDFGDSTEAKHEPGACSSSTRGVVGGGVGAAPLTQSNVMDYVTIASLGNAQDFGDLTVARRNITSAQSPTRGIFFGGRVDPASVAQNIIDYITIATTGNALDFGDLTTTRGRAESVSNATRAVCIGGENPSAVTTMEYVTMSSTGNSVNFGTCSSGANNANNGASNSVRGVFHSAFTSPANTNNLDYITIAATGNTTDFGDLNYTQTRTTAFSDSHGGLG